MVVSNSLHCKPPKLQYQECTAQCTANTKKYFRSKTTYSKKAYCTGLYIVKFLLRLAMFSILLYHLIIEHIPFFGIYTAKIYGCIILYILMLSNLNLGVNIGRYFSSKLQKRTKISINIICLFPSVTGLYLFYKEGIWKHYIQFKKLPECNLLYYYLVTLFFIQIGFLFYELTIGRESST